jgi:hypothetical protein
MAKVGKSEDLTHEVPGDPAVLVKGEGDELVSFTVLGTQVQAVSPATSSKQRHSATAKISTALTVMLYTVALLAAFSVPAEVTHTAGAATWVTLTVGGAGATIVLGLTLLLNLRPRTGSR